MKKPIKLLVVVIVIVIIACLLIWRFLPQSFSRILSIDPDTVDGVSAGVIVNQVANGQFGLADFSLDADDGSAGEIIDILSASSYRRDFRNLLPWGAGSIDGGKDYDGQTLAVLFYNEADTVYIQFLGSRIVAVSNRDDGNLRIYHATNPAAVDQLTEYIQSNAAE